jgi:hypothetical protein
MTITHYFIQRINTSHKLELCRFAIDELASYVVIYKFGSTVTSHKVLEIKTNLSTSSEIVTNYLFFLTGKY